MRLVEKWDDIRENIETLESYRWSEKLNTQYRELIQKGICFVVTLDDNGNHLFSPSRFIGYIDNLYENHILNFDKYGGDTNTEISKILGKEPYENEQIEKYYKEFCVKNDIEYKLTGAFGKARKYWVFN
ncbi:hypothetical protein BC351_00845 [Paenibacillus ferrarius]|uniref:Uncharacterized protein n=1 Tax=Paenibacillus ferrarius TaxID=1469647 RepID=A0A1V4HSC3_9BACL|nr:hypothetical protein [Paenibacillus ferrarius]OPH61820.1 hypothetical protein BC351_00845 [Paenibacillus ferrarius]